jgi:DMSO/TMAO reductase YedYZ molybdopterin-dependent catalytic subunit
VLDASGLPDIAIERWKFSIRGKVIRPAEWNWEDLQSLPRVKVFSDFHCVTRWSRLGNGWEGASTRVPRPYAWKSAKWVAGVELLDRDEASFGSETGMTCMQPREEERYGWRGTLR